MLPMSIPPHLSVYAGDDKGWNGHAVVVPSAGYSISGREATVRRTTSAIAMRHSDQGPGGGVCGFGIRRISRKTCRGSSSVDPEPIDTLIIAEWKEWVPY
jgi:hypothetical protein